MENIELQERWPIVWVRYLGPPTERDTDELFAHYQRLYSEHEAYGLAVSVGNLRASGTSRSHTTRMAQWMKENRANYEGKLRGLAFISTSGALRFGLSAMFLIQPLTVPYDVVATEEQAEVFLQRCLSLPPAILQALSR